MPLTEAQQDTLEAHIAANTATAPGTTGQISALAHTGDNAVAVEKWYNLVASPVYLVWNTQVELKVLRGLVDVSKYTPTDNPPGSGTTIQLTNDALLFQNRSLVCQLKQANAIYLIQGEGQIDCRPLPLRQSFNDCMTLVPSGAAGANTNAGWGTSAAPGAVRLAMHKPATNAEKLYAVVSTAAPNAGNVGADARGSATNPDTLVVVGNISDADVRACWNI